MKKKLLSFLLFLLLNFSALGLGVYFMNGGPLSDWYIQLNQAPWTPPGPVFGLCWSFIMICFAFYMSHLLKHKLKTTFIWILYTIQWILNSGWNYVFFNQHNPILGLITILLLLSLITYFLFRFRHLIKKQSLWILPYFLWLIVATSLNAYIVIYNP